MMGTNTWRARQGRRFASIASAAAVALVAIAGCADVDVHAPDWDWPDDFSEVRSTDYEAFAPFQMELAPAETVSLIGIAGSVEIVGVSGIGGIRVEGVRRVRSESAQDAEQHLEYLRVEASESGGTLFLKTRQPPNSRGRQYEVEYRIEVPFGTALAIVHTAGPVDVRTVSGDVEVDAAAGTVTLDGVTSDVRVNLAAGEIDAALVVQRSGVVELTVGAGDIRLSIPTGTSAALLAAAAVGTIHLVDLALDDRDPRASVLDAVMADGSGTIRLHSAAGRITVVGR